MPELGRLWGCGSFARFLRHQVGRHSVSRAEWERRQPLEILCASAKQWNSASCVSISAPKRASHSTSSETEFAWNMQAMRRKLVVT